MAESITRKNIDLDILDYYDGKIKGYVDDKVGTGGLTIDDSLSDTSINPVQNKVITNALNNKADNSHTHTKSEIIDFPTSLPASDVKAWAKADTKPTYTASEVGADASGSANIALTNAKSYTDTKIADLINGAPTTLDTLGEIATAMEDNQNVVDALNSAIGTKANGSDLTSHTGNKSNPHGVTKTQVDLGNVPNVATNDQTPTFTEASSLTKLSSGEKLSVAFGKISKAITDLIAHIGDSVKHITSTERTNWNAAKTHADSAHAPSNAQANVIETVKVNGEALTPSSKAVDINVPSVGNGTITIKQAGTTKGTFTTNQSGNTTIELADSNTTYSVATSSALGLVKSGTDITVDSSGNVSVNDDSHNHVISNVDGLQSALDGKASSSHTHSSYVNQNAFSNIVVGSTTVAADTATDTLTLVGSNVTLTPDATNDKVTIGITKANVTSALGYTPPTTNTTYSSKAAVSGGTDVSLVTTGEKYNWNAKASTAVATTSSNGLMPSSSLSKLNGIESGAIRVHKALTSNGTTATTTKGYTYGVAGVTTSPYNYAKWYAYLDSGVTTLTNGMIISIKIPVAGCNYGCCVSIDGGTTFKPVVYNSNSIVTGHYGTGVELLLMYDSNFAASVWSNSSSAATITGVWRVMNMWDSGNTISSAMCYTSAETAAKTATFSSYPLLAKSYFMICIAYSNTAKSALTLNINNRGAKPIHINGGASSASNYTLPAGTYIAYYDGTNYCFRTDGKIPANISGDATTVNGLTVQTAVPANAKFTDTVYTHPTTSGNKHIPSGGSSGQILKWSADGTAVWSAETNTWRGVVDNLTSTDATKSLSANQGKVLKGLIDGKAASSHTHNAMTGATADAAGTSGFVPAPVAGDQDKFLRADGTWSSPPSIGSSVSCIVNGTGSSFTYEGDYKLFFYNIKGINTGNSSTTITYESKNGWAFLSDTSNKVKIKLAYYTYQSGASSYTTVNYYLEVTSGKVRIIDSDIDYLAREISGVTLEIYAI